MSEPIPHEEFIRRLADLFAFFKKKGNRKKYGETVRILINDNINMKQELETRREKDAEKSSEEGTSSPSN